MVLLATSFGFSSALCAFLMGSILAETAVIERIEKNMKPLKDFFGVDYEEVEQNKKPVTLATSVRDIIEEYLTMHQHLDREIDGRLTLI